MKRIIRTLNRPIAPHLTIYSGQFTSMYSIWHRLTGISLVITLVLLLTFLKIFSYETSGFIVNFFLNFFFLWKVNSVFLVFILVIIYHLINGIRHISWDLGYNLSVQIILRSVKVINLCIFFSLFFTLYKIIT